MNLDVENISPEMLTLLKAEAADLNVSCQDLLRKRSGRILTIEQLKHAIGGRRAADKSISDLDDNDCGTLDFD